MLDKFEEVNPESKLTLQERAKRAEWARKAYYQRLAMKSAAARRRRKLICPQMWPAERARAEDVSEVLGQAARTGALKLSVPVEK